MKLHEKIYYYRKKAGLSQDALAEQADGKIHLYQAVYGSAGAPVYDG